MHLAYLDDSDTRAKENKWQVMSAVVIEDMAFKMAEIGVSLIPEELMGADNLSKFEEFHACELYGGHKAFEGIDQERRFHAITCLLRLLDLMKMTVVYGAVNLDSLKTEIFGSASPVDVCFRKCVSGIRAWADHSVGLCVREQFAINQIDLQTGQVTEAVTTVISHKLLESLTILIVDDCDPKTRSILQQSFRDLRPKLIQGDSSVLEYLHDDLYFGDSRFSIGIQLADLCSYFIARHLSGDMTTESFYQMIEPRIYSNVTDGKVKQIAKGIAGE